MSEANDIIQAIKTQLDNYTGLDYLKSLTVYEDEIDLEDKGLFPYINIDLMDFRVQDADNMSRHHMERRVYPVMFLIGNRDKLKSSIKEGSASFKGLFKIYDDIKAAIYTDLTFSKTVREFPWRPDFASDVSKHENGEFWIGRAMIIFQVYKDVMLV